MLICNMLQSWGKGRRDVCVKCDYREKTKKPKKTKVIKRSKFGWKFKSNLSTWRTASSASIHSPVSQLKGIAAGYSEA